MHPITMSAIADEHIRDLHESATRHRLEALARCCQPSTWAGAFTRVRAAIGRTGASLRRAQLGPIDNYCACP